MSTMTTMSRQLLRHSLIPYSGHVRGYDTSQKFSHTARGIMVLYASYHVFVSLSIPDGNTVELYDGGSWLPSSPMRHHRHSFAAAVAQNRIYVAGGIWDNLKLSSLEYRCPETGSWTVLALRMPEQRACFQLAVIGDKMYAVGGDEDSSIKSIDSMYTDNQWMTEPLHYPHNWENHASVVLNRHIYVVGWYYGDPVDGQFRRLRPDEISFTINLPPEIRFNGARLAVLKMRPCEASERPIAER